LADSHNQQLASDRLFSALNGQDIEERGVVWTIRVVGIHPADAQMWIQLVVTAPGTSYDLVVKLPRTAPPAVALASIRKWLEHPTSHDSVVQVPPAPQ
jgi:hypothetical protein